MNLTLSWDLFIIVFFAVVITYSFIIGKKESVRVIIASYIAIVAVQAVGNLLLRATAYSGSMLSVVGLTPDVAMISVAKLVLFIAIIVILAVKSGFDVVYTLEMNSVVTGVMTGAFGFATAGLLLSTLLTYAAGSPLLDVNIATNTALATIIQQSQLMQVMIVYQDAWFALPAVLLLSVGFIGK